MEASRLSDRRRSAYIITSSVREEGRREGYLLGLFSMIDYPEATYLGDDV